MHCVSNIFKTARKAPDPFFKMDNYLLTTIKRLQAVGMWPIVTKSSNFVYILLNIVYILLLHAISIHIFLLGAFELKRTWDGDIDKIAPTVINTNVYLTVFLTMLYFEVRIRGFKEIVDFVNEYFHIRSEVGMDFMTIEPSYKQAKKFSNFWFVLCVSGALHWTLYPMLVGHRCLPIAITYPFDTQCFPEYQLVYVLQGIAQVLMGMVFFNLGSFYMCLVILTCGQYDILFCSLKNIRNTAMLKKGLSLDEIREVKQEYYSQAPEINEYYCGEVIKEDLEEVMKGSRHFPLTRKPTKETSGLNHIRQNHEKYVQNFDLSAVQFYVTPGARSVEDAIKNLDNYLTEYNEELTQALAVCVQHHQMILQFCRMMEDLLSPFMIIKVVQATFLLCFIAYNASTTLLKADAKLLNLVEYLFLAGGEMFLFCLFGEVLTVQSEKVGAALMRSPWHLCGGPFRRGIQILLEASSKPVVLTGGKIFKMNLLQFRALINTTFSYFTVLRNLQDK